MDWRREGVPTNYIQISTVIRGFISQLTGLFLALNATFSQERPQFMEIARQLGGEWSSSFLNSRCTRNISSFASGRGNASFGAFGRRYDGWAAASPASMDRPPGADFLVHGRPGKDEAPGEIRDRGPEPVAIGEPSARRAATPIANPLYVRCRATDHLDQDFYPRLSAASEIARIARPRTTDKTRSAAAPGL
jgi:hypothetical protein